MVIVAPCVYQGAGGKYPTNAIASFPSTIYWGARINVVVINAVIISNSIQACRQVPIPMPTRTNVSSHFATPFQGSSRLTKSPFFTVVLLLSTIIAPMIRQNCGLSIGTMLRIRTFSPKMSKAVLSNDKDERVKM